MLQDMLLAMPKATAEAGARSHRAGAAEGPARPSRSSGGTDFQDRLEEAQKPPASASASRRSADQGHGRPRFQTPTEGPDEVDQVPGGGENRSSDGIAVLPAGDLPPQETTAVQEEAAEVDLPVELMGEESAALTSATGSLRVVPDEASNGDGRVQEPAVDKAAPAALRPAASPAAAPQTLPENLAAALSPEGSAARVASTAPLEGRALDNLAQGHGQISLEVDGRQMQAADGTPAPTDPASPPEEATTDSLRVLAPGAEAEGDLAGDNGPADRRGAALSWKPGPANADAPRGEARAEMSFKAPEGGPNPAAGEGALAEKISAPGAERGADIPRPVEGGRSAATFTQGEPSGATEAPGRASTATPDPITSGATRSEGSALREGQWSQLVEKAVFSARNGLSEARIDLKPEHLGPVRLQILTENSQVSIRIIAETAAARDLLESHLHSLRQELQQQGLKVESFDVTLADDHRSQERQWQAAGYGGHRRRPGGAAGAATAGGTVPLGHALRPAGAIDYFV
jgi:flagellar hook-length control protein FliK